MAVKIRRNKDDTVTITADLDTLLAVHAELFGIDLSDPGAKSALWDFNVGLDDFLAEEGIIHD